MTMHQPDLSGRTALITGGGRGIGRATALALSHCGARVVLLARGREELDLACADIQAEGGEALAVTADVSREDEVQRAFEACERVDILINNAGIIGPITPLTRADPHQWQHNIAINLHGVFLTCRYALPGMQKRNWGRIVNVSSGAARGTTAGWSAYSAAKAGVEALTGVLAREVSGLDIRINAVRPGIVDTDMQVEIRESSEEEFGEDNLRRFRDYKEHGLLRPPAHPARLILWMLSDDAADTNGQTLAIDDPETAQRIGLTPMGR